MRDGVSIIWALSRTMLVAETYISLYVMPSGIIRSTCVKRMVRRQRTTQGKAKINKIQSSCTRLTEDKRAEICLDIRYHPRSWSSMVIRSLKFPKNLFISKMKFRTFFESSSFLNPDFPISSMHIIYKFPLSHRILCKLPLVPSII
jgi:hypothetical protein